MKAKFLLYAALVLGTGLFPCGAQTDNTNLSPAQLVEQFRDSKVFWQQFDIAEKIVALRDTNVLQNPVLTDDLTNEDRHVRGNAAFIFAALGDDRGFETLCAILGDRSARPPGQGVGGGNWTLQAQIAADRYEAVWLFGALEDPRAAPILIPLLHDKEVNYIVPVSLGEIGDKQAIPALIEMLDDKDPSLRVLAIYSLEKLHAMEALPRLRTLMNDRDRTDFGDRVSVADAAGEAIFQLKPPRDGNDIKVMMDIPGYGWNGTMSRPPELQNRYPGSDHFDVVIENLSDKPIFLAEGNGEILGLSFEIVTTGHKTVIARRKQQVFTKYVEGEFAVPPGEAKVEEIYYNRDWEPFPFPQNSNTTNNKAVVSLRAVLDTNAGVSYLKGYWTGKAVSEPYDVTLLNDAI